MEVASAGPLAFTTRERSPKFEDLLWHNFGGVSKSQRSRGLRIQLPRPHCAPHRHLFFFYISDQVHWPQAPKELVPLAPSQIFGFGILTPGPDSGMGPMLFWVHLDPLVSPVRSLAPSYPAALVVQ